MYLGAELRELVQRIGQEGDHPINLGQENFGDNSDAFGRQITVYFCCVAAGMPTACCAVHKDWAGI